MDAIRRIGAKLATIVLVAAVGAVATATPASAADCYDGEVCLFEHVDFAGTVFYDDLAEGKAWVTLGFNDTASSVKNMTPYRFCFYRDINYGEYMFELAPYAQLGWVEDYNNDAVSSFGRC